MLQKMIFAVRAKPGLGRTAALEHLQTRHGPLVAASATNRRRIKAYVHNVALDVEEIPGLTAERDWIIESWRDPSVILPDPPEARDAILVREDEARFPDRTSLLAVDVIEAVVSPRAAAPAPIKLFTYFRRRTDIEPCAFSTGWAAAAATLAQQPALRRYATGYVRNIAIAGAGKPKVVTAAPSAPTVPGYDGIDVWHFADIDAVYRLFADRALREALDGLEALTDPGSLFRLATKESVVFDDAGVTDAV